VKLSDVEPFNGMLPAPNAFVITGAPTTVTEAFDVLPVPPSVEVMPTELFLTPDVVPVTSTETVHKPLALRVPAERLTDEAPVAAVAVPPHELVRFGVAATTNPAGRLSVNANPVSDTAVFGF
jgi:hypothetical protein